MAGLHVYTSLPTHLEPDVLGLLKNHQVRSIDQLVVTASPNPEVHLITKLKCLRRPVEVDQLYLSRWSNETYRTMISITATREKKY